MQTNFSSAQLADPAVAVSEQIIRNCVHCGFCASTCPTYVLLGDELDSPRGRIYLMKDMLENERAPTAAVVRHIDRCLSCLSCATTCPSGVNYMHLVDHARSYIESRYRRPFAQRILRRALAAVLPHPRRLRAALRLARLGRPLLPPLRKISGLRSLRAMLELAQKRTPQPAAQKSTVHRQDAKLGRIILLRGCVESVLEPQIRTASVRLLRRAGYELVETTSEVCCGALVHHLGREAAALEFARRNIDAWDSELARQDLKAITTTASGCGTSLKHYGFLLRNDPAYAQRAARISALAKDISEVLIDAELPAPVNRSGLTVAYHSACSLQHGQSVHEPPRQLLKAAGYEVREIAEAHLCCGSAGTYNLLQPQIAARLRERKLENIRKLRPDVIAAGNIGCIRQIAAGSAIPVLHTVELLDWASGGPRPVQLHSESAKAPAA